MTGQLPAGSTWVRQPGLTARSRWYAIAASSVALAFGIFLPIAPHAAVAWLATILLAFAAPVWLLSAIVAITVVVPFELLDALSVIGGHGRPSLFIVDVLLLVGLLRVGWRFVRGRLEVDLPLLVGTIVAAICVVALIWGIGHGAKVSMAGDEARRAMLGVGAFLIAWPLVNDQTARRRLARILIAIGLVLGLWGLAQWMFSVGYTHAGDVGVRISSVHSSPQLQGGMFAFPVAMVLAWAALISGQVRNAAVKRLLAVIFLLNVVCIVLTFERTTWLASAIACLFVAATSGARARRLALRWTGIGLAVLVGAAAVKPGAARTALERLTSVGGLATDNSYKYRLFESQAAAEAIAARPFTGSGFGATITWGVEDLFGTITTPFVHNGYLWLAWKIGIPAAAVVVLLLVRAVLRRCPSEDTAEWHILRKGSQASVLAILLTCLTFPPFNSLAITATLGLLVAICYSPAASAVVPHRAEGRDDAGL